MYVEHLEHALEAFGPVFVQIFRTGRGADDDHACPRTSTSRRRPGRRSPAGLGRPRDAGRALTDRLDEDDRPQPPARWARFTARGDSHHARLLEHATGDAEALRAGWLHTGDVGYRRGRLLFTPTRKKDMIISGGSNIYPREIEEVICRIPACSRWR
jgi:long-chain acyl-CoA synthetase